LHSGGTRNGSTLAVLFSVFWFVCHLFVVGYEEPTLKKSFGAEYDALRINVPRWIPRLTGWRGGR
jgi:protein-S-isoprenylcysteine O-methyltransferase Ste14